MAKKKATAPAAPVAAAANPLQPTIDKIAEAAELALAVDETIAEQLSTLRERLEKKADRLVAKNAKASKKAEAVKAKLAKLIADAKAAGLDPTALLQ